MSKSKSLNVRALGSPADHRSRNARGFSGKGVGFSFWGGYLSLNPLIAIQLTSSADGVRFRTGDLNRLQHTVNELRNTIGNAHTLTLMHKPFSQLRCQDYEATRLTQGVVEHRNERSAAAETGNSKATEKSSHQAKVPCFNYRPASLVRNKIRRIGVASVQG